MISDLPRHPFEDDSKRWPTEAEREQNPLIDPYQIDVMWATKRCALHRFPEHGLAIGTTRSGKTNLIKMFMHSLLPVLRPGDRRVSMNQPFPLRYRAMVTDVKIDYIPWFYRMGFSKNDYLVITNPFDQRCSAWDIAGDLNHSMAVQAFANAICPQPKTLEYDPHSDDFWQFVANQSFFYIIQALRERAKEEGTSWDLRDVLEIVRKNRKWLEPFMRMTSRGSDFYDTSFALYPKLADSCRATLLIKASILEVPALLMRHAKTKFSINKWREKGAIILLGHNRAHADHVHVLNTLLARYAFQACAAYPGDSVTDYSWFLLDELSTVGTFPDVVRQLQGGAGKGVRVVIADQSRANLVDAYGEQHTIAIYNLCSNKAYLALPGDEERQHACKTLGEEGQTPTSHTVQPDGQISHSYHDEDRLRVTPKDFDKLRLAARPPKGSFDGFFLTDGTV